MGIIFSRFRKKKTTVQQLDEIEQKISSIEKFHKETEQRFRRVIGRLIVSSILFYALALCGYYYYFSPDTFRENILSFVPLLVFPVVILLSRKMLSWYYQRKLSKNEGTLKSLKSNKKKILDEVMDKEIYKVAKEILEKYAPEQLITSTAKSVTSNGKSKANVLSSQTPRSDSVARQRLASTVPRKFDSPAVPTQIPNMSGEIVPRNVAHAQPRLSLPRPILPHDRGAFDKLVDMIIGDGPANRYALICRVCSSHNGMALKHEFEYMAFHCAYCMQWNPARKQKPQAPYLALDNGSHDDSDANNSEPETTEVGDITLESQRNNDTGDKLEPKIVDTTTESVALSESSELAETQIVDDGKDNVASDGHNTTPTSDGVDLSTLRKVLDELETDVTESEALPVAPVQHAQSASPSETVDTDAR